MSSIVRGPTLSEQVYSFLRDRIVSGEYRPGQPLVEAEIASELEVSRTPVSNALIMLKERGLLDDQGSKLAVPTLSIEDVIDLYRCRLALDGLATRLAAELVSAEELTRLERHLEVWERPSFEDDLHALWVADLEFHQIIYQLTANRHLINFAQISSELAAVYRRNTIRRLDGGSEGLRSPETVRDEHQRILEALATHDPDRAEAAARHHIENVIAHLEQMEVVTAELPSQEATQP